MMRITPTDMLPIDQADEVEIHLDGEHIVKCATCEGDAIQREVWVRGSSIARFVSYDVHINSVDHAEHNSVFDRLRKFHTALFELQAKFNELSAEDRKLAYGQIIGVELQSIKPTACEVRTEVRPVVTVRAFRKKDELELPARSLSQTKFEALLAEIKEAARPVVESLKAQAERGD